MVMLLRIADDGTNTGYGQRVCASFIQSVFCGKKADQTRNCLQNQTFRFRAKGRSILYIKTCQCGKEFTDFIIFRKLCFVNLFRDTVDGAKRNPRHIVFQKFLTDKNAQKHRIIISKRAVYFARFYDGDVFFAELVSGVFYRNGSFAVQRI